MMICWVATLTVYGSQPAGGVAPPGADEVLGVHPAAVGDAVVAVAGEDEVVVAQGAGRADLGGFLAQQRRPEGQFALPLEGGGLGIDPADDHHVLVERAELLVADVLDPGIELGMADALTRRGDELDEIAARPPRLNSSLFPGPPAEMPPLPASSVNTVVRTF